MRSRASARWASRRRRRPRCGDLGRLFGRQVTLAAAADPEGVLGPSRPLADPGRPIDLDGGVDELLAKGFDLPLDAIRAATSEVGLLAALRQADVPVVDDARGPFDGHDAEQLRAGLTDAVARVFADAAGDRPGGRARPRAHSTTRSTS